MTETLGMRNNNPGNIRANGIGWQGMIGKNAGFCVFDNIDNGVRALALLLKNYVTIERCTTIRQIINRYAPPVENNTDAYVDCVAQQVGIRPVDVFEPTPETVRNLIAGIIMHENGGSGWIFFTLNRGGYNTIDHAIIDARWKFEP